MNDGVEFSHVDYKNDIVSLVDVNTTLMFFRDWIKSRALAKGLATSADVDPSQVAYLLTDPWCTYCAEHQGAVDFVATAIQFSEVGFKEIYGDTEGALVWGLYAKLLPKIAHDRGLTDLEPGGIKPEGAKDPTTGAEFEPLWKRLGFTAAQIKPFAGPDEVEQYRQLVAGHDAAKMQAYEAAGGTKPLEPGVALPFGPQTTSDMMSAFVKTFYPFLDVGGFGAATALLAFKETAMSRMGISEQQFLGSALPVVMEILAAEALREGASEPFFASVQDSMKQALEALLDPNADAQTKAGTRQVFAGMAKQFDDQLAAMKPQLQQLTKARVAAGLPAEMTLAEAQGWLDQTLADDVAKARALNVGDWHANPQYNIPPALFMSVANGLHANPEWNHGLARYVAVGTLMDAKELEAN